MHYKPTLKQRAQYAFDNLMAAGTPAMIETLFALRKMWGTFHFVVRNERVAANCGPKAASFNLRRFSNLLAQPDS